MVQPTTVLATDPRIAAIGRWGRVGDPPALVTVNSGSRLRLRFHGRSVHGLFDPAGCGTPPQLWISIDGGDPRMSIVDSARLDLTPDGLTEGDHELELTVKDVDENSRRWTPPLTGAVRCRGFVVAGPVRPARWPAGPRLLFLGDSITQGVRALNLTIGPDGSDGRAGFAFRTAVALDAAHAQVGFGRQGVRRPGNGGVPPATDSVGWNFAGSPATEPADAVVVNLGHNDVAAGFAEAYEGFLRQLRRARPAARILAMIPLGGAHAAAVAAAARRLEVTLVDTAGWLRPEHFTDGSHPTVRGHQIVADRLVPMLRDR